MNESTSMPASRWVEIIDQHRQTYQLGPWGIIPREHYRLIAQQCGESELAEIRLRLSELETQSREVPEWDEDAQDEIWRAMEMFVIVLKFHGQDDPTAD
jgi:hypothetical protein